MGSNFQSIQPKGSQRRTWILLAGIVVGILFIATWSSIPVSDTNNPKGKKSGTVEVVSVLAIQGDVPVRLAANGTVSARQSVEVRPQISATVKVVHIKEGSFVKQGDVLFTLDTRTETANLNKAQAQLLKDRADLANAERNLERQRKLLQQKLTSQEAFDTAQSQVDGLRGQLAVNQAAVESFKVTHSFGEITAPIAGRTGAITVYPGSLVQPNGTPLVSITQIDPINVSFTLAENELATVQQALSKGEVPVTATLDTAGLPQRKGRLTFVDNAVDTTSGTIRLKAEFENADTQLWPGMFITVSLAPRTLMAATTIPVQAVQTGPENKFVYVISKDQKFSAVPAQVRLVQDGIAVVTGISPGDRVIVEGAQNLRPNSLVAEAGEGERDKKTKPRNKSDKTADQSEHDKPSGNTNKNKGDKKKPEKTTVQSNQQP